MVLYLIYLFIFLYGYMHATFILLILFSLLFNEQLSRFFCESFIKVIFYLFHLIQYLMEFADLSNFYCCFMIFRVHYIFKSHFMILLNHFGLFHHLF